MAAPSGRPTCSPPLMDFTFGQWKTRGGARGRRTPAPRPRRPPALCPRHSTVGRDTSGAGAAQDLEAATSASAPGSSSPAPSPARLGAAARAVPGLARGRAAVAVPAGSVRDTQSGGARPHGSEGEGAPSLGPRL
jgi:hypothetical protein